MSFRGPGVTVAGAALLMLLAGCPTPNDPDEPPVFDSTANDAFNAATALPLDAVDELLFQAEISVPGDLDLFDLGPLVPGDTLFVDVHALSDRLDLVAGVFDSRQFLHYFNDDRVPDASDLDPLIDYVVREGSDPFYLAVTPFFDNNATGTYEVRVQVARGGALPAASRQLVFLNWAGGQDIVVPNVGVFDLGPFDAADLGPYGGQTGAMKDRIQQVVEQRYAGYDLIVLNSDDNPRPVGPHTTVHFGGRDARAFAISEQIDPLNADSSDDAIVFTRSFNGAFLRTPTFEQMAVAVGNTVAHEVGHLLGLVHTADCDELMDASCSNESLLVPQEFGTAILHPTTFPEGWQAAREVLEWILGLAGLP